jgi:very-short-patch-repair endonuclease
MVKSNPMKNPKIAAKSRINRLKNRNIWIPKLSKALMGNKNALGCTRSLATRKILSKQKLGNDLGKYNHHSKETRARISLNNKVTSEKLIQSGQHTLQKVKRVTYSEDKFAKMYPKLVRQFPIKRWLADFYDPETKTVIEIDGSMHRLKDRQQHDRERDQIMKKLGYKVVRIPAKEVLQNNYVEWRNKKWLK